MRHLIPSHGKCPQSLPPRPLSPLPPCVHASVLIAVLGFPCTLSGAVWAVACSSVGAVDCVVVDIDLGWIGAVLFWDRFLRFLINIYCKM